MRVLIIGDTILDQYTFGEINRLSPEAPVPILEFQKEEFILGGACNVAANIRTLTKKDIEIDYFGYASEKIIEMLKKYSISFVGETISESDILKKTRFVSKNHHLLRLDFGKKYSPINKNFSLDYDLIIISDYDKGTLNEEIFEKLENYSKRILVDLKKFRNWITDFSLSKIYFKCNELEYEAGRVNTLVFSNAAAVIKTKGSEGYSIIVGLDEYSEPSVKLDSPVADIVGAGDVFLAGMAAYFLDSNEFNVFKMTEYGNLAAGCKVKKFGTKTVSCKELENVEI